jgi:hypothetical protein
MLLLFMGRIFQRLQSETVLFAHIASVHFVQNHLDADHFHTAGNDTITQIQRLVAKLNEFVKELRRFRIHPKRLAQTFTYALGVEETSPPEEGLQEQECHFTSCDGMLMWKIDNIKSRFSMRSP